MFVPSQQYPPPQVPSVGAVPHWSEQPVAVQVGVWPAQATQTPSQPVVVSRHEVLAVPELQVPPVAAEQQPPLHGWADPQSAVQVLVAVSHAAPAAMAVAWGQSAVSLHPHAPATQACPAAAAVQSKHRAPSVPQLSAAAPAWHVPAAEQQPPLHGCVAEQAVVHLLVAGSQE